MKIIPIYYHLVSNKRNPLVENLYSYKDIGNFRKDLDVLVKKYTILDYEDIKANKSGLVLSFDDGFSECYNIIYPLLKEYSIPAFFFINNDFLDNKNMFYRAKISLLISKLAYLSPLIQRQIAYILECKVTKIKENLLAILEEDKHKLDNLMTTAELDIERYLEKETPYLSSEQVKEMINAGYYFGGHTHNHHRLKNLPNHEQEKRIVDSALDIQKRFNLPYSICSLPHNDQGISNKVFASVSSQIDYLFGGYGLNHQRQYNYLQRISNEHSPLRIDKFINTWKILHSIKKIIH
jgi:peptidoglycan/xylan/chitin deacetylase (PgdA/CDA1 family)